MNTKDFLMENYSSNNVLCFSSISNGKIHNDFKKASSFKMPNFEENKKDLYVSMNPLLLKKGSKPKRDKSNISKLKYLYMDLDFYKLGLDKKQVINILEEQYYEILIPTPTMVIDSGRGLYLLWKINEHRNAYPRWKSVQEYLYNVLKPLGADGTVVTDSARLLRLVGSFNSKSNTEVCVLDYRNFSYTLYYIINSYNIYDNLHNKKPVKKIKRSSTANEYVMNRIIDTVTKLLFMRNSSDCYRENMLFIIRHFTYAITGSEEFALNTIKELNRKLNYPLSDSELEKSTYSAIKYIKDDNKVLKFSNKGLIKFLSITEEECTELGLYKTQEQQQESRKQSNRKYYLKSLQKQNKRIYSEKKAIILSKLCKLLKTNLTVKEICSKLNISKSTFYNYKKLIQVEKVVEVLFVESMAKRKYGKSMPLDSPNNSDVILKNVVLVAPDDQGEAVLMPSCLELPPLLSG